MNICDEIIKLKKKLVWQGYGIHEVTIGSIISGGNQESKQEDVLYRSEIDLNSKIEKFLEWYKKNMLHPSSNHLIINKEMRPLKHFIEKMAIWYELRYPNYELDKLFGEEDFPSSDISEIMFWDNEVMKNFTFSLNFRDLKWSDFYNAKCFIQSLTEDEKRYIERPKYPKMIWLDPYTVGESSYINRSTVIYPSVTGKIMRISQNFYFKKDKKKIIGMSLKEFSSYLMERGDFNFINGKNGLEEYILQYENKKYCKEGILDSVMYKIMERGGNFYGSCRAYLFAKEFKRDQALPIKYAMNSCSYLDKLLNSYLDDGGNFDLECYVNYFDKLIYDRMTVKTIREYFKEYGVYTSEETILYQRLVNSFVTYQGRIPSSVEDDVKQKRLERKLNRVKNLK